MMTMKFALQTDYGWGRILPLMCGVISFVAVSACAPGRASLPDVRGQPVPTAVFLFFDIDSAQPQADSERALRETAAFLVQYDNTIAKIVGHVAADESMDGPIEQRIDTQRAASVGTRLMQLGVSPTRIEPFGAGRNENMAQSMDSTDIDRRVDILFGVQ